MVTASPALPEPTPSVPAADPAAIRACLPPDVLVAFDCDWDAMMDQAKQKRDLTIIHNFLDRWRIMAAAEVKEPESYRKLIAVAEEAERGLQSGNRPTEDSVPLTAVLAEISARLDSR